MSAARLLVLTVRAEEAYADETGKRRPGQEQKQVTQDGVRYPKPC